MQRSKELQLIDENGKCKVPKLDIGVRNCDRVEEITLSEIEDESKSASRSTTSDSQVRIFVSFLLAYHLHSFISMRVSKLFCTLDNRKIQSHS